MAAIVCIFVYFFILSMVALQDSYVLVCVCVCVCVPACTVHVWIAYSTPIV